MHTRYPVPALALALLGALSCGKSPDAPPVEPALSVKAGGGLSDTISATLTQALVVEVRGRSGKPESGVAVEFAASSRIFVSPALKGSFATSASAGAGAAGRAQVGMRMNTGAGRGSVQVPPHALADSGALDFGTSASAITGADGRAAVHVLMGTLPGPASVKITVPLYGLADSAAFTVLPGAAFAVRALVRDTSMDLGDSYAPRAGVVDRAGNLRSEPVTFEATAPAVQVGGTGLISAVAIGRAYVRVRGTIGGNAAIDSMSIMVVPKGRLAVCTGKIKLESLAGGAARDAVVGASVWWILGLVWSPTGDQLAFYQGETRSLMTADTLGHVRGLSIAMAALSLEYSPDGAWIYIGAHAYNRYQIFRVHSDGTGLEALQSPTETGYDPSPSPDGTRLAYATPSRLVVRTLATGQVDTLVAGDGYTGTLEYTRWSPDGNWIAYTSNDQLGLIRPDGSGLHRIPLPVAAVALYGFTWSPDSKWLLAYGSGRALLVDVTTEAVYPLTIGGLCMAWHR